MRLKKIKIRVTEEEFQQLKARSNKARLAEWMREYCLNAKQVRRKNLPIIEPKLLRQLAFIGNNINQLTKLCHIQNNADLFDLLTVAIELNEINENLNHIKQHYSIRSDDK